MKGFRNLTWNYKLLEELSFFKVSSEDTRASPYLLQNKQNSKFSVLVEFTSYMFHPVMKISPYLDGPFNILLSSVRQKSVHQFVMCSRIRLKSTGSFSSIAVFPNPSVYTDR